VLDFPNNRLYLKDGIRYADPPAASAAYADARKAGSIDPADFSQADFQELFRKQAGLH